MIDSPCRTCKRIDQPKDECYRNCELLQKIQVELAREENGAVCRADQSEESRFSLHLSSLGIHPLFN